MRLMRPETFERFIAIDWSGARGSKHRSIAVALCTPGKSSPRLISSVEPWSRQGVLAWMRTVPRALIGFDFSFAPPWVDIGAHFRFAQTPNRAVDFWQYVDRSAMDDVDLGASHFVERGPHRAEFYLGKADGVKSHYMRLRACEQAFNAQGGGKPSSIFDAMGAAQVCKASFAGMRLLHHAHRHFRVWPFEPSAKHESTIVEIYTRAMIQHAGLRGLKVRTLTELNRALHALGSRPCRSSALGSDPEHLSDHESDVLIAAAGLRALASEAHYWSPPELTPQIATTEGWTFGVL